MSVAADRVLRMSRRFEAAPERVFDAWTSPALVGRWLFTTPIDESYQAQLDLRVGQPWTITARRGGIDYTASGEYLVIERPRRLVFTFAMLQFSPESDQITIEIVPDGAGCILTLTQEGVDIAAELRHLPAGVVGATEHGWMEMFDQLELTLADRGSESADQSAERAREEADDPAD